MSAPSKHRLPPMGDKTVLLETGQQRETIYNTADKYEEEDIEDQIRASKKKDPRKDTDYDEHVKTGKKTDTKRDGSLKKPAETTGILKRNLSNGKVAQNNSLAIIPQTLGRSQVNFVPQASFMSSPGSLKGSGVKDMTEPAAGWELKSDYVPASYKLYSKEREKSPPKQTFEGRLGEYKGDEDSLVCKRFPHKKFCACDNKCYESETNIVFQPTQITPTIYVGSLEAGINTKELLRLGITHILNVSCVEYTKRETYFEYYNLPVYNNHDEDIKKFFRITNRFIQGAVQKGKVLIHGEKGTSRAPSFAIAYLINNKWITFKEAINLVSNKMRFVEINDYFKKQLEDYDLGKLASIANNKQDKSQI